METRYLRTLVAAVETGSFSRAAEQLHMTQSAISQRIKFLEDHYGHQLLDRSGTRLIATEVGEMVLDKTRNLLAQEDELLAELHRFNGKKRLAICCTPTFGTAYLPEILNCFMLRHGDVSDLTFLFLQTEDALRRLRRGEFDLAVVEHCQGLDFSACKSYMLPQDDLVFVVAPELAPASGEPLTEWLLRQRLFARKPGCSSRQVLELNLAEQGQELADFDGLVISDDLRWTLENVKAGSGIAFLSAGLAAADLATGNLQALTVPGFIHQRSRTVAYIAGRGREDVVKDFLEILFESFADQSCHCQPGCAIAQSP